MNNPAHKHRDFWKCFYEVQQGCKSVLEVGCAEGNNLRQCEASKKVGIEVHEPYVNKTSGVEYLIGNALQVLPTIPSKSFDLVLLIDIVEHFYRKDGDFVLREADRIASKKILLWIPIGLMVQNSKWHDNYRPWSEWLEHKSSYSKKDLEKFGYDVAVWDKYHNNYLLGTQSIPAGFCVKEF